MTVLKIKVRPGARKNEIAGMWLDMLKIKISAQPESGKANKMLIDFLAEKLVIPKNQIQILKGQTSREKAVEVKGLTKKELFKRLDLRRLP